jgi:DNA-binding transcriptional MerR regulator
MTKVKEDLKLIDYLKEKGIPYDDLKAMIEESITTMSKESSEDNKEPKPEPKTVELKEEVPTFTKEDVKELIQEEVQNALKIKRKVPSKGIVVDKEEIKSESNQQTKREIAAKDWFEVLV